MFFQKSHVNIYYARLEKKLRSRTSNIVLLVPLNFLATNIEVRQITEND